MTGTAGSVLTVPHSGTASTERFFRRTERRYRTADRSLAELLTDELGTPAEYDVRTVYYTHRSKKREHRIRARYYGTEPVAWIECKRRVMAEVIKRRVKKGRISAPWREVGSVTYHRRAWEAKDLRVTLDEGVSATSGMRRSLPGFVLEVKGEKVPVWLRAALPSRDRLFSKRRWVQGRITDDLAMPPSGWTLQDVRE